jgi:ankyrin repeat protein
MSRNPKHELLKQARKGHFGRIERLIGRDVDINCQGKFGQTPLFEAALAGQLEAVRFLLNHGADPRILSNDCAGPLFFACARGYIEIVNLLIEHGADVNASRRTDLPHGTDFCSPLQVAISNRHDEIAKKLVDSGANLDHRVWGLNMIEYAARQGSHDLLSYLTTMKVKR